MFVLVVEINHDGSHHFFGTPSSSGASTFAVGAFRDQFGIRPADEGNIVRGSFSNKTPNDDNGRPLYFSDDSHKVNYVRNIFDDRRFTGYKSRDIDEIPQIYSICARQYNFLPFQKANFFVRNLDGSARRFFLNTFIITMNCT